MFGNKNKRFTKIGFAFALPILLLVLLKTTLQIPQLADLSNVVQAQTQSSTIEATGGISLFTYLPMVTKCFIGLPHPPISTTTNFAADVEITYPTECTAAQLAGEPIVVEGTYDNITGGLDIWVLVRVHSNDRFYPQSDNACAGTKITQNNQAWNVTAYLGAPGDPGEWFDLVAVLTDAAGTAEFVKELQSGCNGSFDGIAREDIEKLNITEVDYVPIRTRDS